MVEFHIMQNMQIRKVKLPLFHTVYLYSNIKPNQPNLIHFFNVDLLLNGFKVTTRAIQMGYLRWSDKSLKAWSWDTSAKIWFFVKGCISRLGSPTPMCRVEILTILQINEDATPSVLSQSSQETSPSQVLTRDQYCLTFDVLMKMEFTDWSTTTLFNAESGQMVFQKQ